MAVVRRAPRTIGHAVLIHHQLNRGVAPDGAYEVTRPIRGAYAMSEWFPEVSKIRYEGPDSKLRVACERDHAPHRLITGRLADEIEPQ